MVPPSRTRTSNHYTPAGILAFRLGERIAKPAARSPATGQPGTRPGGCRWRPSRREGTAAAKQPSSVPSEQVTTTRVTPAWPIRCTSAAASSPGRTVDAPNRITVPTSAFPAADANLSRQAAPMTTPAWWRPKTGPNP
jgi:hypothetical protein